jgi:hypothetical protein
MSDDINFHEAILCELTWKDPQMKCFAIHLVSLALKTSPDKFTTDIVPDDLRGEELGTGIAGSVVELLKTANVLEPLGVMSAGQWYPLREISRRPGCRSRYLNCYKLKSRALAAEFLRRHGRADAIPESQAEFELNLPTPIGALAN